MAKLKNIVSQLSLRDYEAIYESLNTSNAEKSAYLLKAMRERQSSDAKIMMELGVNTNAYYTLRSRLNQKIEEYLFQQMETPRTDVLKKVANINEVLFTKKRAIAIATLQKLEKELIDYDLSNELTVVYKSLKKLHINTPDYFNLSQLYNKHVAYMLAVDKAEDLLGQYFKKYGFYSLSGEDRDKLELSLLNDEMVNVCSLYDSHRLYVYQSLMNIFHRLFVELDDDFNTDLEPIEDILANIEKIFKSYKLDSIYYHLQLVYEFLKLEYYNHYRVFRKAEDYFEDVNETTASLLTNFSLYTYPAQFLMTKIKRHNRLDKEEELYEENEAIFYDFECDKNDIPKYVHYVVYRAISCYYVKKYDEAARWINNLLNELSLKNYPYALLEIKLFLALQYCLMNDYDLFNQLINSVQRQVRILGKEKCEHVLIIAKMMKTSISETRKSKQEKIQGFVDRLKGATVNHFSPILALKRDERFVKNLAK